MADGIIEQFNTRNIYEIVDGLNILLLKKHMFDNKQGVFLRDIFGNETITVDANLNEYQRRIVIAHELGHAILHTNLNVSYCTSSLISNEKLELQANKFAAELLLEDNIEDMYKHFTIKELAAIYNVPERLIELKYKDI